MCCVSAKIRWNAATMPPSFDDVPYFYVGPLSSLLISNGSIANAMTMNFFRSTSMWICE